MAKKMSARCWQERSYKVTAKSTSMTQHGQRVWIDPLGTCYVLWRIRGCYYFYELSGERREP